MNRAGGKLLADQLAVHGTEIAYCVPGESYIGLLDGLYDSPIRLVTCRHEASAANMAEAYGKLTGRPGVCMVTRGPGATHAAVGVHTAFQDSTPMILLVGQVSSVQEEREAFQEIDYRRMFGQLAKWVAQIDHVDRIPELIARAFTTACAGRPGPVVLALPEDMLGAVSEAADAPPFRRIQPSPAASDIEALRGLLERAERPFAIIGGGGWTAAAATGVQTFLEANVLSAGAAFRRQDAIDNDSPSYAGDVGIGINPALGERVESCGSPPGRRPAPRRDDDLRLHADRRAATASDARARSSRCRGARSCLSGRPADPLGHGGVRCGGQRPARGATLGRLDGPGAGRLRGVAAARPMSRARSTSATASRGSRARLPNAIVCNGAGNHTVWVHRFWRFHDYPSQLAPTSGAMGYGVPAALAAKALRPDRDVICFSGDGDFLMSGQELATAVQYGLPIVIIVVDNGMYGTIRMHQERQFPGRVVGTDLVNPDFGAYARSFGAHGETVEQTDEFPAALERALESGRPAVIALRIDPEAITPRTTLSAIRAAAQEGTS